MKKLQICLQFVLLLSLTVSSYAQSIQQRYRIINDLLTSQDRMMPAYLFDSIAGKYQDGIAGTLVKQGKVIGTSLSIDEKSATANIGIVPFTLAKADIYSAATVTGETKDKFNTVFSDGRYQTNIGAGGVFNIFLGKFTGSANCADKILARHQVEALRAKTDDQADPYGAETQLNYIMKAISHLEQYKNAYCRLKDKDCEDYDEIITSGYVEIVANGEKALDTLSKLGLIEKNINLLNCDNSKLTELRQSSLITRDNLIRAAYVRAAEKVYMEMPWQWLSIYWITISAQYKVAPYDIIDPLAVDKDYKKTFHSEYSEFLLSGNFSWYNTQGRQFQFTVSPTIKFSTPRNFDEKNKITITKHVQYTGIPGDSSVKKIALNTEGYEKIADRVYPWSVELPFTFLWNKYNFGIDFAIRAGSNDPTEDNVGGRLGFFIPIEIKDDVPVWIEPVVRVGKLFNKDEMNFWKENVIVGFNLSIALKKYTVFGKK